MQKYFSYILLASMILISGPSLAQSFFRIKADFSIKQKSPDGSSSLTTGTVYYDMTARKIVYSVKFPEPSTLITTDSCIYHLVNDSLIEKQTAASVSEFSIFHLALNGHLPDYGLASSSYSISEVEKDKDMVITSWEPPYSSRKELGKIMVSNKGKKLFGIIFFTPEGEIISKQFFEEYQFTGGLNFPGKIVQISLTPEGENYQVSTFRNIIIDELKEDHIYNYRIPVDL